VDVPPPPGVSETQIVEALERDWGLGVERLAYVPKGFGSYHWEAVTGEGGRRFVTVDDLTTKTWLGAAVEENHRALRSCYRAAHELAERRGLSFVVAPLPDRHGEVVHRLSARFALSVYPFVPGPAGRWGVQIGGDEARRVLRLLADLHGCEVETEVPDRGLEVGGRPLLEAALDELDRPCSAGPFSERARAELAAHRGEVVRLLESFDDLAARFAAGGPVPVVCHGEPHPGNLIGGDDGIHLVDWDTVGCAPAERDLWMFELCPEVDLDFYEEITGRRIDRRGLALYRLAWILEDLAAFVTVFRSPHELNAATQKAWDGLTGYLRGDQPRPYG